MIDDQQDARPPVGAQQRGGRLASARREGGILATMLVFQDQFRQGRRSGPERPLLLAVTWAAEWRRSTPMPAGRPRRSPRWRPRARASGSTTPTSSAAAGTFRRDHHPSGRRSNLYTSRSHAAPPRHAPGGAEDGPMQGGEFAPDAPLENRPVGGVRSRSATWPTRSPTTTTGATNTYSPLGDRPGRSRSTPPPGASRAKNVIIMTDVVRAAQRRPSGEAPARGTGHRQRRGLDLDQREDDPGDLEEAVAHGAHPVLRCQGQPGPPRPIGQTFIQVMRSSTRRCRSGTARRSRPTDPDPGGRSIAASRAGRSPVTDCRRRGSAPDADVGVDRHVSACHIGPRPALPGGPFAGRRRAIRGRRRRDQIAARATGRVQDRAARPATRPCRPPRECPPTDTPPTGVPRGDRPDGGQSPAASDDDRHDRGARSGQAGDGTASAMVRCVGRGCLPTPCPDGGRAIARAIVGTRHRRGGPAAATAPPPRDPPGGRSPPAMASDPQERPQVLARVVAPGQDQVSLGQAKVVAQLAGLGGRPRGALGSRWPSA